MLIDKTEKEQAFHAKMLSDCADVLEYFKIPYHLSNSALLGAYRDGDMIPWSNGAVLNVLYDDAKPYEDMIKKMLIDKGFIIVRHFKKQSKWKIRADKLKYNIEITGYYKNNGNYERKANKRIRTIPIKYIEGVKNHIELRGRIYPAPADIENFLNHMYVDWKTKIRTDKRSEYKNHKHIGLEK